MNKTFNDEMRIMKGLKIKSFSLVILMVLMSISSIPIQNLTLTEEEINLTSGRAMACTGDICLNEAMPNPNGYDDAAWPGGEWMEVTNVGTQAVDVRNFQLENKASKTITFDSNSIVGYNANNASTYTLNPGDYMVIARNGYSNFYLANSFDSITLLDSTGNAIDQASWNSSSSGISLEETTPATADWVNTANPTPGQSNNNTPAPVQTYPADLVMNEVMPNPWPSYDNATYPGGEWIEILNTGQTDFDVSQIYLEDLAGNVINPNSSHLISSSSLSGTNLAPGGYAIMAVNGLSTYGMLNNAQETMFMKWSNGTIAQEIEWRNAEPGYSYCEDSTNPNATWIICAWPTPGDASIPVIQQPVQISDLELSEIVPHANGEGQNFPVGEWIELYNNGSMTLNLIDFTIMDAMGNVTQLNQANIVTNETQNSTFIAPNEYRIIQFTEDTELWNRSNNIFLMDNAMNVIDTATWRTIPTIDAALIRDSDPTGVWKEAVFQTPHQPQPGELDAPTYNLSIHEIMPNPFGNDENAYPQGEWVEILNYGSDAIDIAGFKLKASSRTLTLDSNRLPYTNDTVLQSGQVALVSLSTSSSFYLKNSGQDSLALVTSNDYIVDSVDWTATVEGETMVDPSSSHAGAGPDGNANGQISVLITSAWPTPNQENPQWPAYTGPITLDLTEIYPFCPNTNEEYEDDWFEFHNTGTEVIDLARWQIINSDGEKWFIRGDRIHNNSGPQSPIPVAPDHRIVVQLDNWSVSGLGDSVEIRNPDSVLVQTYSWSTVSECQSISQDESGNWVRNPWITPGMPEPTLSDYAGAEDIKFSRIMPDGTHSLSSNMEFFELSNVGQKNAVLSSWQVTRVTSSGSTFSSTFENINLESGKSVIIGADASALSIFETGAVQSMSEVMTVPLYLPDDGGALQLITSSGEIADTVVWGNGDTTIEGWSGTSVMMSVSDIDNYIYHRGDNCGEFSDTNTSTDWMHRWSVLGATTICNQDTVQSEMEVIPLLGPETGIVDILAWIQGATSTLEIMMYQIQHPLIVEALIDAEERGVEVSIVLDAGESWWKNYDLETQKGMAAELVDNGVEVFWFGIDSDDAYAYLHAKIAVRDSSSVWISSGNWKSSSLPNPSDSGNREWSAIIHSEAFAQQVKENMMIEFDSSLSYIDEARSSDRPNGWVLPQWSGVIGPTTDGITANVSADLFTCPDTCLEEISTMISNADSQILLSLQYLEIDWYWGWSTNPVLQSLEEAAQRGVEIKLIVNGAFLDEDIQDIVDRFNEDWNATMGYDVSAVIMSSDESVEKLHNKGAIIDGESVLISSINWGDSALLRNREYGVLLTSPEVTAPYLASWYEDWDRLDSQTDTDNDGLPDYWEVEHGMNRTWRFAGGPGVLESSLDPDNDGFDNLAEFQAGTDPNVFNEDGEIVDPNDGNDTNNNQTQNGNNQTVGQDNNTTNQTEEVDSDNDGVIDSADECSDTPAGQFVDAGGCTNAQRSALNVESESEDESTGFPFMTIMMLLAVVLFAVAIYGITQAGKNSEDKLASANEEFSKYNESVFEEANVADSKWSSPVLNHNQAEPDSGSGLSDDDIAKFPGWDRALIEGYIEQGWTIEQLSNYYQEEVSKHQNEA